jgi:membrane associated rhomboid family serine protease
MIWTSQSTGLKHIAPVTHRLIVINVVVLVLMWLSGVDPMQVFGALGLVPSRLVVDGGIFAALTVGTSMFLHAGLWHLLANMVFLYFFGRMVEPMIGSRHFAWLYGLAGVGAAAFQVGADPLSMIPMVGASGAVSGVLGAAVFLRPRQKVLMISPLTLFIPVRLSIWMFGLIWVVLQGIGALGIDWMGSDVAFLAHLGGFLVGLVVCLVMRRPFRNRRDTSRTGPAPNAQYRTFIVTDAQGHSYEFHDEKPSAPDGA